MDCFTPSWISARKNYIAEDVCWAAFRPGLVHDATLGKATYCDTKPRDVPSSSNGALGINRLAITGRGLLIFHNHVVRIDA